jgi:NAD(P)-dependent dehydrogenase (short-subunit alcohol dehydrogenase family)
MDLHLSGKIAVVTGASKGIGLAITQALVDAGAHAIAGSRTRGPKLGELEEAGKVTFVSADLSTPDAPMGWLPPPRTTGESTFWSTTPERSRFTRRGSPASPTMTGRRPGS